ncbi:MAG: hypothetical protein JSW14_03230 [Candidatus Bathyarchaeum sp.]|nr:MAG: hypothetical protein JSW14_03230 [Candidatus Bathyarchaeum sp.]
MNKKKSLVIGLLLVLSAIICFNINPVFAALPSVVSIEPWTSGTDTILNITVSHAFSQIDYLESADVEIDGTIHTVTISNQDSDPFVVQYNMGEVTGTPTVRARGYCTNAGYGDWSESVVVPEFSSVVLLLVFITATIIVIIVNRRKQ